MELYYYTSTDSMHYILQGGNIYATNIRYMNDSQEYLNGLNELRILSEDKDLLKKIPLAAELDLASLSEEDWMSNSKDTEFYSISFCATNDLLSQWAIYAKESGTSLKMNFKEEDYTFTTESRVKKRTSCAEEQANQLATWKISPKKIFYFTKESMEKNEYEEIATEIIKEIYYEKLRNPDLRETEGLKKISTIIKRYDFYQENEYRLAFSPKDVAFPPHIKYRHDNKILKPYLNIKCEHGWPIWEIMIGPGMNQQIVFDSLEHFLNNESVKVGIKNSDDYIERVKSYLDSLYIENKNDGSYNELMVYLSNRNDIDKEDFESIKKATYFYVQKIIREIESDPNNILGKEFIKSHIFTRSGVIITRSSIPYIF